MFEFNKRCEYCANYYRHPDAGCGSCVNGNNYIDSDFVPLPSFSLTGTKTVVKAHGEEFDPEKGLAMAISKKVLGTGYYPEIKKWTKEYNGESFIEKLYRDFENSMNRISEIMTDAAEALDAVSLGGEKQ